MPHRPEHTKKQALLGATALQAPLQSVTQPGLSGGLRRDARPGSSSETISSEEKLQWHKKDQHNFFKDSTVPLQPFMLVTVHLENTAPTWQTQLVSGGLSPGDLSPGRKKWGCSFSNKSRQPELAPWPSSSRTSLLAAELSPDAHPGQQ